MLDGCPDVLGDGGSCIAGPDGGWIVARVVGREALLTATLDHAMARRERQNFNPAGPYSRLEVTRLLVDGTRQGLATFIDSAG